MYRIDRKRGEVLFQCTEIGHSISNDGWYTTLKGKMRYIPLNEARERWKK